MNSLLSRSVFLVLLCAVAGPGLGQDKQDKADGADKEKAAQIAQMDKFILDTFKANQGTTLCMLGNVPVASVRAMVVAQLKVAGVGESATQKQVETALWTVFPCPFSPFREEVRPATAKDVAGAWLFPEDSQPFRYGPSSPSQPAKRAEAVTCEAVGFFPKGELRTGTVVGSPTCPFRKAADLAAARKRPRVASWAMVADGKLKVTRTDNKDYLEEWDVFAVTKTFRALTMELKAGDLITYLRDKNSDVNASTEFRHLQRLK
jgi:hypothetical protein